jgi:hypothetical protein
MARIDGGDGGEAVLVDEFDQLPEPRADNRHVGCRKRQGQPLGRIRRPVSLRDWLRGFDL